MMGEQRTYTCKTHYLIYFHQPVSQLKPVMSVTVEDHLIVHGDPGDPGLLLHVLDLGLVLLLALVQLVFL